MQEIWKDVPEYEGIYQVSNLGNVRSLNYNNNKRQKKSAKRNIKLDILMLFFVKIQKRKTKVFTGLLLWHLYRIQTITLA